MNLPALRQSTHCRNGHSWATAAYVKKDGKYFCKVCCNKRRAERRSLALKFPDRVQPAEVRLMRRIDKTPGHGPWGDCWVYTGETRAAKGGRGYGQISKDARIVLTHRLAYEIAHGPIQIGLNILHKCDNPPCCNPEHLTAGTQAENNEDKIRKGRGPNMKIVALTRRNPVGERNGMAQLKWEWVRAIRGERKELGTTYEKLAVKFGTTCGNISNIINNKAWREEKAS